MDIAAWLRELGLERYEQAFRENEIDAEILPKLNADDLKDIGVTAVGHRRKLLEAIAALAEPASAPQAELGTPAVATPRASPAEAERRQLTVLFCDLVGSTKLSARLDPEDMGAVIREYQECCAEVVRRWDGHVAKYMGDGVLVYFGYPQAHEDDAERAVRSGLELAQKVARLTAGDGTSLAARIGIATGLVMVGDLIGEGTAQEQTVVGETPNLAARLQGLATASAVVIAPSTRQLLGGLFDLQDLGRHELKGLAEPVQAWSVIGESQAESRFEAMHPRGMTPLVGRDQEIALLLDRWALAKEAEGQVVLLSGEPGIGKSRIIQALRERLASEPHTRLSYYCSPYHTNSALHPVINQLKRAAGFGPDDSGEAKLAKLEALLGQATRRPSEVLPVVAALLSTRAGGDDPSAGPAPQVNKARTFGALTEQLDGLAARQPVLMVFEDAHWIDPTTTELFEITIDRIQHLPVLLVIAFRPNFRPPWTSHAHTTTLTLNRLGRSQGASLVRELAGGKALPSQVLEQILTKTDGVPLFVEELTKTVLESGLLDAAGDQLEPTAPLPPLAIPTTLHDSLMARLDRLARVKEIAQIGAAIGREFSHRLLAGVAGLQDAELGAALEQLIQAELVFRRGAPPDASYVFKHALVRDAAHQSLLRARRHQLHARIGRALEKHFPGVAETEPEVLAHHYTEAGLTEQALAYWLRAGQRAARRSAYVEAINHCSQGLELLATLPDNIERARQELVLQTTLGPALMNVKGQGAAEVEQAYARARQLCQEIGEAPALFPVLFGLWYFYLVRAELGTARGLAEQLLALAEHADDDDLRLAAHRSLGQNLCFLGELDGANPHLRQALALYDRERHQGLSLLYGQDLAVICRSWQGLALWLLGYPDRALQVSQTGCALAEELAHPYSQAYALNWAAMLHVFRRDAGATLSEAEALMALSMEQAYAMYVASGRFWQAWARLLDPAAADDPAKGLAEIEHMREGLAGWRATGAGVFQPLFLGLLGEACATVRRTEAASAAIDEALQVVERTSERYYEAELHRIRGVSMLQAGNDPGQAEQALHRALQIADAQRAQSLKLRAATSLAKLWADQGERQKANDLLAPVHAWFTEGFDTPDLKDAKALLDELA